ncbi:hypothetical protein DFP73DRAFT_600074 [Morchella snyderi]|nr:hypothetical protein DFP73DRAFT_600074 [Morchella snyderi]
MPSFSLLPVNIALIIFTLIFTSHNSEATYRAIDTDYQAENCYETTPECVESFDTMVVCGARIQNPISAYLDTSFFTATQLECLCTTRGYSRNAVTCAECFGYKATGWTEWCVKSEVRLKELPMGTVIGATIGGCFIASGVAFTIYLCVRKRRQARRQKSSKIEMDEHGRMRHQDSSVELDGSDSREELW